MTQYVLISDAIAGDLPILEFYISKHQVI